MEDSIVYSENQIRIIDLLEQIREVNKMIDLHQSGSKEVLMVNQYTDLKNRFLEELNDILNDFAIRAIDLDEQHEQAA